MTIAPLLLAATIQISSLISGPCSVVGWLYCTIPWDAVVFPWVPDVQPVDLDLEPADDIDGPELDELPDLDAPDLTIPEDFELDVPEFPSAEEGEGESEEEIEAQVNLWLSPLSSIREALEGWIGDAGALPDAAAGDFETGFDNIDDESGGSAFTFAANMGSSIGILFEFARSLSGYGFFSIGTLVTFVMACSAWLALYRFFMFAFGIADMLWSVLVQGVQALGEALPWPW